jgi:hypothetical protein
MDVLLLSEVCQIYRLSTSRFQPELLRKSGLDVRACVRDEFRL